MLTNDEENAEINAIKNAAPFRAALDFYREQKLCPCAFPRYVQMVSFDSRKVGLPFPASFLDAEILIHLSTWGTSAFYERTGEWLNNIAPFRCQMCGSATEFYSEQFSIAMWVSAMTFKETRAVPVGANTSALLPLMVGFHSFRIIGESLGNSIFRRVTPQEMFQYLTERRSST